MLNFEADMALFYRMGLLYGIFVFLAWSSGGVLASQLLSGECGPYASEYAASYISLSEDGDWEGLEKLLNQWEMDCPSSEPLFRARWLFLMAGNPRVLPDSLDIVFDHLVAFTIRREIREGEPDSMQVAYFQSYSGLFGYVPLQANFDRYTQSQAQALLNTGTFSGFSRSLLRFWAGTNDNLFGELRDGVYQGQPFQDEFDARVKKLKRQPDYNFGIFAGGWRPSDHLTAIGNKPLLGVYSGLTFGSTSVDLLFSIRFGSSAEELKIPIGDSLVRTRNQQSGSLGLGITQRIISLQKWDLSVALEGGFDMIDIVDDNQDPLRYTSVAIYYEPALMVTRRFANRSRIWIKPGFQFLHHKGEAGNPLNGNAITVTIGFGLSDNAAKRQKLKRIGFE